VYSQIFQFQLQLQFQLTVNKYCSMSFSFKIFQFQFLMLLSEIKLVFKTLTVHQVQKNIHHSDVALYVQTQMPQYKFLLGNEELVLETGRYHVFKFDTISIRYL